MPSTRKRKKDAKRAKAQERGELKRQKVSQKLRKGAAARVAAEEKASASEQAQALKARGNERFGAGDAEGAAALYEEAIVLDPGAHVLHSNLAACRLQQRDFRAAAAAAKRCVELAPGFAKGYFRLATALRAGAGEGGGEGEGGDGVGDGGKGGAAAAAAAVARDGLTHAGGNADLRALLRECEREAAQGGRPKAALPAKSYNERIIPLPAERPLHPGVIRPRKGQMLLAATKLGQRGEAEYNNNKKEARRRRTKDRRERYAKAEEEHLNAWDDA
eukprot:g6720.t1